MEGLYIEEIPTQCWGCSFCDPEYGGDCVLMPNAGFESYEEQFRRCPFHELVRCGKYISRSKEEPTMVQPEQTGTPMSTTTTTAWPPSPDYCASRLPCGVCLILDRMCPKMATYQVKPTWYQNGPTCVNEVSPCSSE